MSSDEVRNMVNGVVEHGGFDDVLFFVILRSESEARQFFSPLRGADHDDPFSPPTATNMAVDNRTNDTNVEIRSQ